MKVTTKSKSKNFDMAEVGDWIIATNALLLDSLQAIHRISEGSEPAKVRTLVPMIRGIIKGGNCSRPACLPSYFDPAILSAFSI